MADLYETVRVGNQALTAGDADAVRAALVTVQTMLDVFGLRADDPVWTGSGDSRLRPILDGVISELLEQRQSARARKDFAAADAIRTRLTSLGVSVEDTPNGSRWSL
jgi:cysteinyl-tRNA synthetase